MDIIYVFLRNDVMGTYKSPAKVCVKLKICEEYKAGGSC